MSILFVFHSWFAHFNTTTSVFQSYKPSVSGWLAGVLPPQTMRPIGASVLHCDCQVSSVCWECNTGRVMELITISIKSFIIGHRYLPRGFKAAGAGLANFAASMGAFA